MIYHKKDSFFPSLYSHFGGNVIIELDLANYASKSDVKTATGDNTLTLKTDIDINTLTKKIISIIENQT